MMTYVASDGSIISWGPFATIGLDVVAALEFLRKHPDIAKESRFDCIRAEVNLMLSYIPKEAV